MIGTGGTSVMAGRGQDHRSGQRGRWPRCTGSSATTRSAASRQRSSSTSSPAATRWCSCRPAAASRCATRSPRWCATGVGVVVSPLIALMQDQVDALTRARRARRVPQLHPGPRRAPRGRGGLPRRRARPALPGAGAAAASTPTLRLLDRGHDRAVRHRRGALRVAVGARLPARLPARCRCCTSAGPTCRASR